MSSDLFVGGGSFYHQSSPEMVSSDSDPFFSDPFSTFYEFPMDMLQELSNNQSCQNPVHDSNSVDNFCPNLLSSSPPSHQLENLSLCQTTQLQPSSFVDCPSPVNGFADFSALDVKTEELQVGYDSFYNHQPFMPHSYSSVENVAKLMQRSYSSNSFEGKSGHHFQPCFDTLLESPNYQNQGLSSPENSLTVGQLRRVCSTGDLQNIRTSHTTQRSFSSPLATDSSFMEDTNFKVGRYSAEERKEKIAKYRAKRNHRNFTKTIKYACRKTLADNRPRIRGRFARNDENVEIPKAACSTRDEEEDELWFDGSQEEEDIGIMRGGAGGGGGGEAFGQAQFHFYGY